MKDLLGRFGFTEFFTLVCPGVLALLTFGVWLPDETLSRLTWTAFEPAKLDSIALAVIVSVLAYCMGMLVNVVATECAIGSDIWVMRVDTERGWKKVVIRVFTWVLWLLQGTFDFKRGYVVDMTIDLEQALESLTGGRASPRSPIEVLSGFRVLVSGQMRKTWSPLVEQIAEVHRRRMFAQATASVLALLAIQSMIRLYVGDHSHSGFFALALGAYIASVGLRFAVSSLWETEVLYTYRIYLLL